MKEHTKWFLFKSATLIIGGAFILYIVGIGISVEQENHTKLLKACDETVIRIHGNFYCFDSELVKPMGETQ